MLIRNSNFSDIDQIVLIEKDRELSCWGYNGYREALQNKSYFLIVCEYQKEIMGFALSRFVDFSEAELLNIGVKRHFEKKSVGRRLLEAVLHSCLKRGIKEMWLEVRKSNQIAIDFYRRNGFEVFGVRKNFYQSPVEDALLMKIELDSLT